MQKALNAVFPVVAVLVLLYLGRGPDGLICKHIYPSAYTGSEQAFWRGLAGGSCSITPASNKEETNSQLRVAAGLGRVDAVTKLLAAGADVNTGGPAADQVPAGGTALMLAAANDRQDVVRLLLSKGANPNQADEGGGTALIYASWKGHLDTVRILLDKGADPTATTRDGRTPLGVARSSGHSAVVTLLERHAKGDEKVPEPPGR